jgi:hypothetical protein
MHNSYTLLIQIFISLNYYENYYIIIIQYENRNIFVFNPTPIPDWSKKYDYQRLAHKLKLVFPLYEQGSMELQESPFRSWVFWNTEVLDKEMNKRSMYLILHTL